MDFSLSAAIEDYRARIAAFVHERLIPFEIDPGVRTMLGDAAMRIDTERLLTMRAAWKLDRGEFALQEIYRYARQARWSMAPRKCTR